MKKNKRVVRVSDTDCTGSLYFTNLLRFAQEGFERSPQKKRKHRLII